MKRYLICTMWLAHFCFYFTAGHAWGMYLIGEQPLMVATPALMGLLNLWAKYRLLDWLHKEYQWPNP